VRSVYENKNGVKICGKTGTIIMEWKRIDKGSTVRVELAVVQHMSVINTGEITSDILVPYKE